MKQYIDDIANGVNVKPEPSSPNYALVWGLLVVSCLLFGLVAGIFVWLACGVVYDAYQQGVRDGKNSSHTYG